MAEIRLIEPDRPGYELPMVCARCGREALLRVPKTFRWCPSWVGLLFFTMCVTYGLGIFLWAIAFLVLTRRQRLKVPLCAAHRHHWLWSRLTIFGGFILVLLLAAGVSLSLHVMRHALAAVISLTATFLVWVVLAKLIESQTIRPGEITEDTITLQAVAPEFVAACLSGPRIGDLGPVDEEED